MIKVPSLGSNINIDPALYPEIPVPSLMYNESVSGSTTATKPLGWAETTTGNFYPVNSMLNSTTTQHWKEYTRVVKNSSQQEKPVKNCQVKWNFIDIPANVLEDINNYGYTAGVPANQIKRRNKRI